MDEREREIREGFTGLVRALEGYFDHLRLVERTLPPPGMPEDDDEEDFFSQARAALECARRDHLEPLLRSLSEIAAPDPGATSPEGGRP